MAEKRKQEEQYQKKQKKFRSSPASGASARPEKRDNNKNSIKHHASDGTNPKHLKKWKKKQKYVFKTLKRKQGELSPNATFRTNQDEVDGNKPNGNALNSKQNFKKAKRRRKSNKKTTQKDQFSGNTCPSSTGVNEVQLKGNHVGSTSSIKNSNESVGKAWKKKRKGKKQTGDGKKKLVENKVDSVLPRKPNEISANWKAMLATFEKSNPAKKQRKQDGFDKQKSGHSKKKQQPSKRSSKIWFDVDPELLRANEAMSSAVTKDSSGLSDKSRDKFIMEGTDEGPTKCVALDCEMVGAGREGKDNLLARVSVVNQYGHCLYDKFVKPREDVTDYRTWVSGVRAKDLETGEDFLTVQKDVADLLKGRILVGHALQNDMKVLFLDHPKRMVRDTFKYEPFRQMFKSRRPGLKGLVEKILHVQFQKGEHNSVEDAQAVMKLYMLNRKQWEASLKMKSKKKGST